MQWLNIKRIGSDRIGCHEDPNPNMWLQLSVSLGFFDHCFLDSQWIISKELRRCSHGAAVGALRPIPSLDSHGALRPEPRQARPGSPREPCRFLSPYPWFRSPSGIIHPGSLPSSSILSVFHLNFLSFQGGEEQTRYCTDHIELFRYWSFCRHELPWLKNI